MKYWKVYNYQRNHIIGITQNELKFENRALRIFVWAYA